VTVTYKSDCHLRMTRPIEKAEPAFEPAPLFVFPSVSYPFAISG
jgi:hypothetical protein